MAWRESRQTAELQKLRAELVEQLEQLDFRPRASARRSRRWPGTLNAPSGSDGMSEKPMEYRRAAAPLRSGESA